MTKDDGRVGKPTGLSQVEPQEGLAPSGFDPSRWMRRSGLHRDWLMEGVTRDSAAEVAKRFGAPSEWGSPVAAFTWTKEVWRDEWDCDSTTKAIAALYANGRVIDIRFGARGSRTSFYTAPRDSDGSPKGGDARGSVHDSAGPKGIAPKVPS